MHFECSVYVGFKLSMRCHMSIIPFIHNYSLRVEQIIEYFEVLKGVKQRNIKSSIVSNSSTIFVQNDDG